MKKKIIRCQDCYNRFVFTIKQQQMYAEKGWKAPIRCPNCRARKKEALGKNKEHRIVRGRLDIRKYARHGRTFFRGSVR